MAVLDVVALLAAVAGAVTRPRRLPAWVAPVAAAVVVLLAGGTSPSAAGHALDPLRAPLAFLLCAVPLAVLLDRYGWFAAVAEQIEARGGGPGALWVLAALVTTVLNLDAGVVLLTPLYVSLARRRGGDPMALAVQPVLLACLASSALPVSNLTNLIAVAATGAGTGQFVAALGLPSLVATVVGWCCYRRWARGRGVGVARRAGAGAGAGAGATVSVGRVGAEQVAAGPAAGARVLATGSVVVAAVLVGFTLGSELGVEPWVVALGADVVLVALTRGVPWREVPVATAVLAATLGILAAAAATHLPVRSALGGGGTLSQAKATGVMALAANVANNLPALLVALPAVAGHVRPLLWSVLVGVNMGPVLLATGSLASLLWLDALGRLGVTARARDFSAVGVRVGLPAAVAGAATHLVLHVAGVG